MVVSIQTKMKKRNWSWLAAEERRVRDKRTIISFEQRGEDTLWTRLIRRGPTGKEAQRHLAKHMETLCRYANAISEKEENLKSSNHWIAADGTHRMKVYQRCQEDGTTILTYRVHNSVVGPKAKKKSFKIGRDYRTVSSRKGVLIKAWNTYCDILYADLIRTNPELENLDSFVLKVADTDLTLVFQGNRATSPSWPWSKMAEVTL